MNEDDKTNERIIERGCYIYAPFGMSGTIVEPVPDDEAYLYPLAHEGTLGHRWLCTHWGQSRTLIILATLPSIFLGLLEVSGSGYFHFLLLYLSKEVPCWEKTTVVETLLQDLIKLKF